jgi:hypothetical protein
MGYEVAIQRDEGEWWSGSVCNKFAAVVFQRAYAGYAEAVNYLSKLILRDNPDCDWVVTAGDDTYPDPKKQADEIAEECTEYFSAHSHHSHGATFGVMQPTGDPWCDSKGRIIERIAGSPWMGREWCLRANQGRGPQWSEYTHMFADEELQLVAQKLGVFWQRPDLTHRHDHWTRENNRSVSSSQAKKPMPQFLAEAYSREHWDKYKAIFLARRAQGFPGSDPLSV